MMTTLPILITDFFMTHLAKERNVSGHTVMAYRDTLKMFLCFAAKFLSRTVDHLNFDHLSVEVILEFLNHLEHVRRNTVRSRNARLAAIHSFFRYVLGREPSLASHCQRVLTIPFKKSTHEALGYLSEEEVSSLLSQVDRSTLNGERDYLLLALLYDTGGRVHEVLNLRPMDFRLERPAFVRISGKGRRERLCPLLPQTANIVGRFVTEQGCNLEDTTPLFMNRSGQKLSRHGVRYLIRKYVTMAEEKMPCMGRPGISPHSLRHAKAMHLLQSGSPLTTIKDILGHADIKSTEVYVQADLQMKRKALELVGTPTKIKKPKASIPPNLLKWLESL